MAYKVESAVPNKLITLTCRPEFMEHPRQVYDRTRRQLGELGKVLRRDLGEFEYLRILEVTKKGFPHYHLLARCPYIPQKTLSDIWNRLTNAPICDVRKIQKCDNVFRYIIKYMCKQTYIPWTNRRASWSRNFFQNEPAFKPLQLDLSEGKRLKTGPSEVAATYFPGREMIQVAPTCFLVVPNGGDEALSLIRQTESLYERDLDPACESF